MSHVETRGQFMRSYLFLWAHHQYFWNCWEVFYIYTYLVCYWWKPELFLTLTGISNQVREHASTGVKRCLSSIWNTHSLWHDRSIYWMMVGWFLVLFLDSEPEEKWNVAHFAMYKIGLYFVLLYYYITPQSKTLHSIYSLIIDSKKS